MSEQVTIIGSGIVGICSALSLLEQGIAVELIDRDAPASGASHGNAGVVSPWSCVPQSVPGLWRKVPGWTLDAEGPIAIRWRHLLPFLPWALKFLRCGDERKLPAIGDAMNALNRPNVELYRHHLKGTGEEHLLADACYVHVYRNARAIDLDQIGWKMRTERGVPLEVIGAEQLHELEPALAPGYGAAVLIKGQARALDPGKIGQVLAQKAEQMGATFRRTGVTALRPNEDKSWTLHTDDGVLAAKRVLIAAGAWSARLLTPLGVRVPLEAERGYHLVLQNPGITVNNSIMEVDYKFVASSMLSGVRCAGTAEFAGLDAEPDYRRAQVFKRLAKRMFPAINVEDGVEWMGSRPSMPDSLPCLGAVPGHSNLFAAFGHSHYGFGMAPGTGRVVAQLLSGSAPNIDLAPYRIDRFN